MTENKFEMPSYPLLPRAGGGKDWPFGPRQLPPELMDLVQYIQMYIDARTGCTPRQWQVMAFIAYVASKDLDVYLEAYTDKWNEENLKKPRK